MNLYFQINYKLITFGHTWPHNMIGFGPNQIRFAVYTNAGGKASLQTFGIRKEVDPRA